MRVAHGKKVTHLCRIREDEIDVAIAVTFRVLADHRVQRGYTNRKENKCIGCRRYYESTCRFSHGVHFTFLTDGVVEARSPKGELARKST